ncbi:DMP19 family protein [Nitrincola sp. MINF-07-Sa-05]|uniref:DMP19 family protein n=1 Tax=Nitrincola salilacus TaxID=3400273 RepID=UPI0039185A90
MAEEYPESFDAVSKKHEKSGLESLTEKETVIYTIWWLEGEINNGGFHQYFWNSSGDDTALALNSLKKIGANYTASLLESAILIAFNGKLPANRSDRQGLLEKDEGSKMDKLNELDSKFYEYVDDIESKVNEYVNK